MNPFRHSFRRTADGVIFYPKGPDGPGFLMEDAQAAERLELTLKVVGLSVAV